MIGMDPTMGRGVLAVYRGDLPEVVDTGDTLENLFAKARLHLREGFEPGTTVIAVPAWHNNGQRQEMVGQARSAGLGNVRLVNRPSAVALAYSMFKPSERSTMMVIELHGNQFDVSVLALAKGGFEILAANGIQDLDKSLTWKPERLYEAIKAPMDRALKDSAIAAADLEEILLSGEMELFKGLEQRLLADFGYSGSREVEPAHAVALGAAVHSKLIEMGL